MSNLLENTQTGLGVASDIFGGVSKAVAAGASASALEDYAEQAKSAAGLKLVQADRQAYMIQGKTRANIGANGLEESGSAESILRMNASNLALDRGLIEQQGAEDVSHYLNAVKAARKEEGAGVGEAIGTAFGAVGGFFLGGLAGAAVGAKLGGSIGGSVGGM